MKNIILITIDCLRADRLEMMPNLKRIASKGMNFEQCISLSRSTPSSFIGMFTSTYPLMYNGKMWMSEPRKPFAEILQNAGYHTVAVHSNPWISSLTGYDRGFDVFDDGISENISLLTRLRNYAMTKVPVNTGAFNFMSNIYGAMFGGAYINAEETNKKALSYGYWNKKPYFMWLHYMDAHEPHLDGNIFNRWDTSKLESRARRTPDHINLKGEVKLRCIYNDRVKYIDDKIGELLDHPKTCKMINNSIIIITADHGYQLFEHGYYTHAGNSLWEELIRIPLIICGDGIPNNLIQDQVSHIDLAPTILDLAGIRKPDCYMGSSLMRLLLKTNNELNAFSEADNTVAEGQLRQWSRYPILDNLYAVISLRKNDWKYIWRNQGKDEFYNLGTDPEERHNLINNKITQSIKDDMFTTVMKHIDKERYGSIRL